MTIRKDVVLITSGGRTGTAFWGETLDGIIDDCWSAHEPDVWRGPFEPRSWQALRWFGPYHVILGKVLRRTGMRCVTERFLSGDWSALETVRAIKRQRTRFYTTRPGSLVVESNWQFFGLTSLFPRVFESYRVLALVRDPRSWVRSFVNFGGHHDDRDVVARYGLPRLSPQMVGDPWADRWNGMDVFERLCWDWRFIARRLVEAADGDERIHLVRFEDLFYAEDPAGRLSETLDFLTDFGHRRYRYHVPEGVFERKVNVSRPKRMGPWPEWPEERRRFLREMCAPLAGRLGYDLDQEPDRRGGSGG